MAEQEREMGKVEMYGEPQALDQDNQRVDIPEGMEPIDNLAEKLGITCTEPDLFFQLHKRMVLKGIRETKGISAEFVDKHFILPEGTIRGFEDGFKTLSLKLISKISGWLRGLPAPPKTVEQMARAAAERALHELGEYNQITKATEKMAELQVSLSRYHLGIDEMGNIREKIVDVYITSLSLCSIFESEDPGFFDRIAMEKVNRLNKFIDDNSPPGSYNCGY